MHPLLRSCALAGAILLATAAATRPAEAREHTRETVVSGSVALVSDYRFRGVSLSSRRRAAQAGIEVERRGWFAGAWASTAENPEGPDSELDFYAGRRGSVAGFDYSVAARAYLFDGEPVYFEGEARIGRKLGPATVELELGYAPAQASVAKDNVYVGAQAEAPLGAGLALRARGGWEGSAFFGEKLDWELGASWSRAPFTLAASVVGADGDHLLPADTEPAPIFSVMVEW